MLKIKNMKVEGFKVAEVPITFYKNTGLEKAIDHLYRRGRPCIPGWGKHSDPDRPRRR